eukprot:TRINITY_DN6040_c0_g1_i1.p1 TRINITY_DN6040_c0_g1~~TRINITY_DN6040_c0_g1_i1.p1  ORF type:complete len:107 (-),score=2.50 TRINITY_DN6040_c0_g1_i1:94-414(-)
MLYFFFRKYRIVKYLIGIEAVGFLGTGAFFVKANRDFGFRCRMYDDYEFLRPTFDTVWGHGQYVSMLKEKGLTVEDVLQGNLPQHPLPSTSASPQAHTRDLDNPAG